MHVQTHGASMIASDINGPLYRAALKVRAGLELKQECTLPLGYEPRQRRDASFGVHQVRRCLVPDSDQIFESLLIQLFCGLEGMGHPCFATVQYAGN